MNESDLLKEIEEVFTFVKPPPIEDFVLHGDECAECSYLKKDLEDILVSEVTEKTIRFFHQELYHFSAKGWRWVLPYYLRYCMTPEATYNQSEIEFLIYNLRPSEKFENKTKQQLSELNKDQIFCLIHFMDWCSAHAFWGEYCPEDIRKAKLFLSKIL